jgi:hypothetical protein
MIAGTDGWILEKKSRNRFSNSGGEALNSVDRSCAIGFDFTGGDPGAGLPGLDRDGAARFRKGRKSPAGPISKKAAICAFALGEVHGPVT